DEVGAELAEADDLSILEQDREQRVDPLEGRRRHLEQAQGMPGGRRVEHHDVVTGGAGGRKEGLDDADDAEDLVESRWREIDEVLPTPPLPATTSSLNPLGASASNHP